MSVLRLALLVLSFTCAACLAQPVAAAGAANQPAPPAAGAEKNKKPSASPYRLLGILDPERDQMVAFALKVPRAWKAEQSFKRQWEGAVAQNKIYISLRSPDGRDQIEYLPAAQYVYSEGPLTNNLRAQKRSLGIPEQAAPNERQPMQPVAFIEEMLLSYLAQNNMALSDIGNPQTAPQERGEDGQVKRRGSVDGRLPNGNKARVECRISINSQQINGDTYYIWSAVPSITQSAGDLAAAYAHTLVAQNSIVLNPAWVAQEREAQNRGAQANSEASRQQHETSMNQIHANTAAMTRAHEQRMNNIRQQGAASTARFNERMSAMDRDKAAFDSHMSSMDRQQEIRVDTIREVSKYADPGTGERVKVEDGYDHVYRNRQDPNAYYGTNTPIEAGQLDWQELQKVELKDY